MIVFFVSVKSLNNPHVSRMFRCIFICLLLRIIYIDSFFFRYQLLAIIYVSNNIHTCNSRPRMLGNLLFLTGDVNVMHTQKKKYRNRVTFTEHYVGKDRF